MDTQLNKIITNQTEEAKLNMSHETGDYQNKTGSDTETQTCELDTATGDKWTKRRMKHEMMNMRAGRTKAQGQDYKGNHRE